MKKPTAWTIRIFVGLLAVCGIFTLVVCFAFNGAEDYARGRLDRIAGQMFDDVDRVEIFLLVQPSGVVEDGTFPVRPYREEYPVYGTATLSGDDAKQAAELWSYTIKNLGIQALCHNPPYGVRMFAGKTLRFESSICWHCNNFYIEGFPGNYMWYGFDADSKGATDLLALFESHLPFPRQKKKDNKSERATPRKPSD